MPHTALRGSVIVDYNPRNNSSKYVQKCEKCGWVSRSTFTVTAGKGSRFNSSFTCQNCRNNQKIEILGT